VHYIAEQGSIPVLGTARASATSMSNRAAISTSADMLLTPSAVPRRATQWNLLVMRNCRLLLPELITRFRKRESKSARLPSHLNLVGSGRLNLPVRTTGQMILRSIISSDRCRFRRGVSTSIATLRSLQKPLLREDGETASRLWSGDAAGVYHNVSTRFADGFRYGSAQSWEQHQQIARAWACRLEGLTTTSTN